MQGLLAMLEVEQADLVGRRETRFSSVPLIGVHLEVLYCDLLALSGALYFLDQGPWCTTIGQGVDILIFSHNTTTVYYL